MGKVSKKKVHCRQISNSNKGSPVKTDGEKKSKTGTTHKCGGVSDESKWRKPKDKVRNKVLH
jgi:hypothetical protein